MAMMNDDTQGGCGVFRVCGGEGSAERPKTSLIFFAARQRARHHLPRERSFRAKKSAHPILGWQIDTYANGTVQNYRR